MRDAKAFKDLDMVAVGLEFGLIRVKRQAAFVTDLVGQPTVGKQRLSIFQRPGAKGRALIFQRAQA